MYVRRIHSLFLLHSSSQTHENIKENINVLGNLLGSNCFAKRTKANDPTLTLQDYTKGILWTHLWCAEIHLRCSWSS